MPFNQRSNGVDYVLYMGRYGGISIIMHACFINKL